MAKKCFFITYVNCSDISGSGYICADDLEYRSGGGCGGGYFYSVSNGYGPANASEKSGTVTVVACSNCLGCCTDGVAANQPYDCINGGCLPKTTYNTPGVFASLAVCQSGCAKNSSCLGECVSASELSALQQAANNLQSKNCK